MGVGKRIVTKEVLVERSLVGKPAQDVRKWVAGYIKLRKLEPLTVDQLLEEAFGARRGLASELGFFPSNTKGSANVSQE